MCSTSNKGTGRKRFKSDRNLSFKSYSDDELIEGDLRHRIRSIKTNLFAEYCAELSDCQVEQLCNSRYHD